MFQQADHIFFYTPFSEICFCGHTFPCCPENRQFRIDIPQFVLHCCQQVSNAVLSIKKPRLLKKSRFIHPFILSGLYFVDAAFCSPPIRPVTAPSVMPIKISLLSLTAHGNAAAHREWNTPIPPESPSTGDGHFPRPEPPSARHFRSHSG